MELRKTTEGDLPEVMSILRQAQAFLKKQGVDQWQDGYPNEEIIRGDLAQGESYVLVEDGAVMATAVLSFRPEPMYEKIYGGAWLYNGRSAVIHRIATDSSLRGRGLAAELMEGLEALCPENGMDSIRVDTHPQNVPMQALLKKCGYALCGTVYLPDGVSERIAFEKPTAPAGEPNTAQSR